MGMQRRRIRPFVRACALIFVASALPASTFAGTFEIPSPLGAPGFGAQVKVLPNGNIVIGDLLAGPNGSGAVHLYRPDGTRISTLTGSHSYDSIGYDPILVLPDGNFLVLSYQWQNGGTMNAGAVTWVSGTDGLEGEISAENSIVGTSTDDMSRTGIFVLANGNYVVASENWHNGTIQEAGAVTWASRDGTTHGVISAANSLVGTTIFDGVGSTITVLANGNYLVVSPLWNNGAALRVGAVTWANGETGIAGAVSAANSLVGSTTDDRVGNGESACCHAWALANGNAVVLSPYWHYGPMENAGAATWIDGAHGATGAVSVSNSLIGTHAGDQVGAASASDGFVDIGNGRYAVISAFWHQGDVRVGAITWASAATGLSGLVSVNNSLVGSHADDLLGAWLIPLANGKLVVSAPTWDNGTIVDAGAAMWMDGAAPPTGALSAASALVGGTEGDLVGYVHPLANGNYVVTSPQWHNGSLAAAGAATWMDGSIASSGVVSTANSLYGAAPNDFVGDAGVVALANGNYIVLSPEWCNGALEGAGAATWGDGAHGTAGALSAANSIVGDTTLDNVGLDGFALPDGNVMILSTFWHLDGAATWMDGRSGRAGVVSSANSLVGDTYENGMGTVTVLGDNGNFIVSAPAWTSDGAHKDLGAAAWGNARTGIAGNISAANALVGTVDNQMVGAVVTAVGNGNALITSHMAVTLMRGTSGLAGPMSDADTIVSPGLYGPVSIDYDAVRDRVVVGWYNGDVVSVFQADLLFKNGLD